MSASPFVSRSRASFREQTASVSQLQSQEPVDGSAASVGQPSEVVFAGQQQSRRRSALNASLSGLNSSSFFTSKLNRRRLNTSSRTSDSLNPLAGTTKDRKFRLSARLLKIGESVLVSTSNNTSSTALVNRFGFPPGEGETVEECRGPYVYVLATVKQVHFEEIHPFYTVTRCDTGADQRADADQIEPIVTPLGEMAARRASSQTPEQLKLSRRLQQNDDENDDDNGGGGGAINHRASMSDRSVHVPRGMAAWTRTACFYCLWPILWIEDFCFFCWMVYVAPIVAACFKFGREQSHLFLYGRDPYICRLRLTAVNFVVLCSTTFMFIDQFRLAFLPPSSDDIMATINFTIWMVLVLELVFEAFIRPNGYQQLIISDKAYAPRTVRFINFFHLAIESISLVLFVPEFICIFTGENCSGRFTFSTFNALLLGVVGPTKRHAFFGHCFIALTRLRIFGLVRHWKNMWITRTFINMTWHSKQSGVLSNMVPPSVKSRRSSFSRRNLQPEINQFVVDAEEQKRKSRDEALTNASNIGTALMATNSYRALAILWAVIGLFPVVVSLTGNLVNDVGRTLTDQVQSVNLIASVTSSESCNYLLLSVGSWIAGLSNRRHLSDRPYLLSLDIRPIRCGFDSANMTHAYMCEKVDMGAKLGKPSPFCENWLEYTKGDRSIGDLATASGTREGAIVEHSKSDVGLFTSLAQNGSIYVEDTPYSVTSRFDESFSLRTAAFSSLLLQLCLLGTVLGGLSILRRDAEVLVLGPLRRMLKIVAHYAKNPLVQPKVKQMASPRGRVGNRTIDEDSEWPSDGDSSDEDESFDKELGSFETEQLITAVAKITDLLRKCWGVAGADIILTNLATRDGALSEVFNPTVPGKSVYALFGFAVIGGFENALRNLGGDVMPLINDVAAVLHDEVFRWGFGDSGQCNKNLGSAFLMVYRIGSVNEVIEKLEQATDVVFSSSSGKRLQVSSAVRRRQTRRTSNVRPVSVGASGGASSPSVLERVSTAKAAATNIRKKVQRTKISKAMSLSLQSLPGISTFTDRAVIGILKSYAGIHRDKSILKWNDDFRLGAGVGAFKISMIFGLDAGWAVEGAVGSEYKIDATYLSPHVNMASRMTSACKQYDVTLMLSQSVQELMSDVAQSKLRHVDTVTVKGSSVKQRIYTYDAKARGVDFFLYSRSDEEADFNADRYSPTIWSSDQDLMAMRQHVTDEFLQIFKEGLKAYISGNWPIAIDKLELANNIMFQTAVDEGYMEDEFDALDMRSGVDVRGAREELKLENGDGPSMYLLNFMKSHDGVAPKKWDGWHPLTRK